MLHFGELPFQHWSQIPENLTMSTDGIRTSTTNSKMDVKQRYKNGVVEDGFDGDEIWRHLCWINRED